MTPDSTQQTSNEGVEAEAQRLLQELRHANDAFEIESRELSLDLDKKLAAADAALQDVVTELEKGESDPAKNTEV